MSEKKYFGTDGIRGKVGQSPYISPQWMQKLGWAFGQSLRAQGQKTVMIGKDTRLSGYMIESALQSGLLASGVDVIQLGPMPTPGISFLTKHLQVSGGIVISASHNPFDDNGIKLFDGMGFKLPDEKELEIEALIDQPLELVASNQVGKAHRREDAAQLYQQFCLQRFDGLNLKGLELVVDCANGAMYHIAPEVFRTLGAKVHTLGDKPDGTNINLNVGSTHPEQLIAQVKQRPGTIGIAFDGDGDRVLMVDEKGDLVDGDDILYMAAIAKQNSGQLKGGVVGTLMTNFGVERAFEQKGIPFVRAQVGDRYVLDYLKKMDWELGGETSGHIIDLSKTNTGDGLIAALLVLEQVAAQGELRGLRQDIQKCTQTLINVPTHGGKQLVASPAVQQSLEQHQQRLNGHGRIVLRPSGTEPLVRIMVEADKAELTQEVANDMAQTVKELALES